MTDIFEFALNDKVRLIGSEENGKVVARAQYWDCCNRYLIRYVAGDGRLVEQWWDGSSLELVQ